SAALTDIGRTLFNAISPCLEGPVDPQDIDATNPGPQLPCIVRDIQVDDNNGAQDAPIPPCKMQDARTPMAGNPPGRWMDNDPVACPAPESGFQIHVERDQLPATGTNVAVECAAIPPT